MQVTKDEIEQWLNHPVTACYLQALKDLGQSNEDSFARNGLVFPSNDDIIRSIFRHEGRRELMSAVSPVSVLHQFNYIKGDDNA